MPEKVSNDGDTLITIGDTAKGYIKITNFTDCKMCISACYFSIN